MPWVRCLCLLPLLTASCKGDDREWITITSAGLEHTFKNGVTLKVPAGAVSADTRFYLRSLAPEEYDFLLRARNITQQSILFSLEGTDGIAFDKDVTLAIPAPGLAPGAVPIVHTLDLQHKTFTQQRCVVRMHPATKTIDLSVSHFSVFTAEQEETLKQQAAKNCADPQLACYCGEVESRQQDTEDSCESLTSSCIKLSFISTVILWGCDPSGNKRFDDLIEEAIGDCKPEIALTPGQNLIAPGEQTTVTADVRFGCAPLRQQQVHFSASGPGVIQPGDAVSDSKGKASTTLTAKAEEGTVTVTATSTVTYYQNRSVADGQTIHEDKRTATVTAMAVVYVSPRPVLDLKTSQTSIKPNGGRATISAQISWKGKPLDLQQVSFSVTGPATVAPATGQTAGTAPATTMLIAQGQKGTATVRASCQASLLLATGEKVEVPLEKTISVVISDNPQPVETWTGTYEGKVLGHELGPFKISACVDLEVKATFEFKAYDPTCALLPGVIDICGTGQAHLTVTPNLCDECNVVQPPSIDFPVTIWGVILGSGPSRTFEVNLEAVDLLIPLQGKPCQQPCSFQVCCDTTGCTNYDVYCACGGGVALPWDNPDNTTGGTFTNLASSGTTSGGWDGQTGTWTMTISRQSP